MFDSVTAVYAHDSSKTLDTITASSSRLPSSRFTSNDNDNSNSNNSNTHNSQRKGLLPPKKRKVAAKYVNPKLPMTILKRQVASKWDVPFSRGSTTGSPFYLERYGEKALSLYPKGPQTLHLPRCLQPVDDPARFIFHRSGGSNNKSKVPVPQKSPPPRQQQEHKQIPSSRKTHKQAVNNNKNTSRDSNKSTRQGVVTPSPLVPSNNQTTTATTTVPPSTNSLTLQPSPLKRPNKTSSPWHQNRRPSLGTAHDPIPLLDDDDTTTNTTSLSTATTNRAVVLGKSQTSRRHRSRRHSEGFTVGHVQFAVPTGSGMNNRYTMMMMPTTTTPAPPGPDRTTTWPAFRPVRKVSLTHNNSNTTTTTSTTMKHQPMVRRSSSVPDSKKTDTRPVPMTMTNRRHHHNPAPSSTLVANCLPPRHSPMVYSHVCATRTPTATPSPTTTPAPPALSPSRHYPDYHNAMVFSTRGGLRSGNVVPPHPLYQAHHSHSGRRAAAFSPENTVNHNGK